MTNLEPFRVLGQVAREACASMSDSGTVSVWVAAAARRSTKSGRGVALSTLPPLGLSRVVSPWELKVALCGLCSSRADALSVFTCCSGLLTRGPPL